MVAGPTMPSASATRRPCSISSQSLIVVPRIDSPPFDSIIVLRNCIEAAAARVAEDVDRELLAGAHLLHHRGDARVAEEELELGPVLGAVDVARAEPAPRLDEHRERNVRREVVRRPRRRRRDPALLEEAVGEELVLAEPDRVRPGQQHERAELVAMLGEEAVVEVGERYDEPHVVQRDELAQRVEVAGVVDARDEGAAVGRVQGRSELVGVDGQRRRAGAGKGGDDVDSLPRAGEEHDGHGAEGSGQGP